MGGTTPASNSPIQLTDIQNLINLRPSATNPQSDPIYNTPAWLYINAGLSQPTIRSLAPYITARSQVYRFQSIGYFDKPNNPVARFEAVVDGGYPTLGRPRIVYTRDLTNMGQAYDLSAISGAN